MLSVFFRCRQKHRNNPKQKLDAEMFILFPSRFLRSVSPTTRSGYPFLFCLSRFRTLPAIECILLCEHLAKCHRTIYIIQVGYRASNFNEIWDSERNTKCILRTKKMSEVIGNSLHGHTIRIMRRKRCASVCRFFAQIISLANIYMRMSVHTTCILYLHIHIHIVCLIKFNNIEIHCNHQKQQNKLNSVPQSAIDQSSTNRFSTVSFPTIL